MAQVDLKKDECTSLAEGQDSSGAGSGRRAGEGRGEAVQVDPMKINLKPPGTKRLKLQSDVLLSTSAFKFNLRRYTGVIRENMNMERRKVWLPGKDGLTDKVRWCRLTVSKPVLKAPTVSALGGTMSCIAFKFCFQIRFAPLQPGAPLAGEL
jgi:hypothetical protein